MGYQDPSFISKINTMITKTLPSHPNTKAENLLDLILFNTSTIATQHLKETKDTHYYNHHYRWRKHHNYYNHYYNLNCLCRLHQNYYNHYYNHHCLQRWKHYQHYAHHNHNQCHEARNYLYYYHNHNYHYLGWNILR